MDRFAQVCERIASYASRRMKTALMEEYLSSLSETERALAAGLFAMSAKASISGTTLRHAILRVSKWDVEVFKCCREATGDSAEAGALLLEGKTSNQPLPLRRAAWILGELEAATKASEKLEILEDALSAYRPLTLKYFLRVLGGNLRIGLHTRSADVPVDVPLDRKHRLLTVITSAEAGRGRLATSLAAYTVALRSSDRFVNVGKVDSGLSDGEIRQLTRVLRRSVLERFGRVTLVRPEVILEVAFESVQKSRHKGGYALRSPRIVRWHRDRPAAECDEIGRAIELYEPG